MAYNPFDFFRRNQKTFFAVLTAFVMIMFVLSFGQGDFFQWLPRWLSSKRGQGDLLATINGRKLYRSELERLRENRVLANRFMVGSNQAAAANVAKDLGNSMDTAGETTKMTLQNLLVSRNDQYIPRQALMQAQFGMIGTEQLLAAREQNLRMLSNQLQGIILGAAGESREIKKDDVNLAKAAQNLLLLDATSVASQGNSYFMNLPLLEKDGDANLLQFELWMRKADKLGIRISPDDAKLLYKEEFYRRITDNDVIEIERGFQDKLGYSRERLWESLADEFRVRAAQSVVLGPGYGRAGGVALQALTAPYEDYQFYREQVVAGTYAMMAVPADNYLDQVTATPSEGELRELFNKYRDKEPNPALETPGFRKPRELKVGFLEVRGNEPFYVQGGKECLQKGDVAGRIAFALVPPVLGAEQALIGAMFPVVLNDAVLQQEYEQYRSTMLIRLDAAYVASPWAFESRHEIPDSSLARPANMAALVGAAVGAGLTDASLLSAALVLSESTKAEDRRIRARILAAAIAPGGVAVGGNLIANSLAAAAALPKPLPLQDVRSELTDSVLKRVTREFAERDLQKFMTEMTPLGVKKDKAEARSALERFVNERGLKVGGSTAFHDVFSIDNDPGLKPLLDVKKRGHMGMEDPTPFGATFFVEPDPSDPLGRKQMLAKSFYTPRTYPQQSTFVNLLEGEPSFLFWRTEEIPAETPKDFEKVRGKVEAAWKRLKARDLAKKAADDLAKQVRETLSNTRGSDQEGVLDQVIRDIHARYVSAVASGNLDKAVRASYFLESNVAPLPDTPVSTGGFGEQYSPYQLKPRAELKYPTQAMAEALLNNKDKPLGTTLVLKDNPGDIFYVSVLKARSERSSQTFFTSVYRNSGFASQLAQAIRARERNAAVREAQEQAIALLEAEFKVEKTEKLRSKSEDENNAGA